MFSYTVQARSSVLYCGTTPMERRASAGDCDDVDACRCDGPGGGQCARRADADGRGLACAIRAQQAVELAFADAEVDTIDRHNPLLAFVDLTKAFDLHNLGQDSPHCSVWCPDYRHRTSFGPSESSIRKLLSLVVRTLLRVAGCAAAMFVLQVTRSNVRRE